MLNRLLHTAPFTVNAAVVCCLIFFSILAYEIHPALPFFWALWRLYDDRD